MMKLSGILYLVDWYIVTFEVSEFTDTEDADFSFSCLMCSCNCGTVNFTAVQIMELCVTALCTCLLFILKKGITECMKTMEELKYMTVIPQSWN